MRSRGLALLIVVGVLGILAVLAAAFVTMAQLERKASGQRLYATKAALLARSGIEDALARLSAGQEAAYGGEDWSGDGALSPYEAAQEVYGPGRLDMDACPPAQAMRPSFFVRALPSLNPETQEVGGKERGRSGSLSPDRISRGNTYSLRVLAGGIHVNGGDPASSPAFGYNAVLGRILGTLAEALDREDGLDDGIPVDQADGEALVALRPPGGWTSFAQVQAVALGGSAARRDALAPYLALHAWVDRKVIAPNALPSCVGTSPDSWDTLKRTGYLDVKPDFERDGAGRVVGRAPVSLPWARTRRPALIALLAGLKGMYVNEVEASISSIGRVDAVSLALDWDLATDPCRDVADRILSSTSGLGTWAQWNAFCDDLPLTSGSDDGAQATRDLLKANFNPNSALNKFNPGRTMWKAVDKMDLLAASTEWSLGGGTGARIACAGRVVGPDGRLLAQRTLEAEVSAPSRVRLTTQREFVAGDLGDPGLAGDETALRIPGVSTPYLSVSQSADRTRTWGHRLAGLGGMGAGLQTYPEPCVDAGAGLQPSAADYDGHLQLATVETADTDVWGVSPALGGLRLLGNYTDHMDLNYPGPVANLPDAVQVTRAELGLSLLDPVKTNTLYPDGAYSESGKVCSYEDAGLVDGFHGVISFWMKNNYGRIGPVLAGKSERRGHRFFKWSNRAIASGIGHLSRKQFFGIAEQSLTYGQDIPPWPVGEPGSRFRRLVAQYELGHDSGDENNELSYETAGFHEIRHGAWSLLTFAYDLHGGSPDEGGEMILDDGALTGQVGSANAYPNNAALDPALAESITLEFPGGNKHALMLGQRGFNDYAFPAIGQGADTTLDELAIYDFGGGEYVGGVLTPATTKELEAPGVLALNRFRTGRYYKGSVHNPVSYGYSPVPDEAASWISAPIPLPAGAVLRRMDWTWLGTGALPDDCAVLELLDPAGTQYLWSPAQSRSGMPSGWVEPPSSWTVGRAPGGAFRIRAVFWRQPGSATVDGNTPILESPVLDDLTLEYDPPGGPGVLSWEPG